jgi:hypothetical protein
MCTIIIIIMLLLHPHVSKAIPVQQYIASGWCRRWRWLSWHACCQA